MALPATIARFLGAHYVAHDVVEHLPTEDPAQAARAAYLTPGQLFCGQALRDRRGIVVAVYPSNHALDLIALNRNLERDLAPLHPRQAATLFPDCAPNLVPVLAAAYGIKVVISPGADDDDIYFEASPSTLIRVQRGDLERVQNVWHAPGMSKLRDGVDSDPDRHPTPMRIRERLDEIQELPSMPEMAQRILQLRANPYADLRELAQIVDLDPSLAAQVVRFARSPLFGYQDKVSSTQEAIALVLGYDLTMNLLLGIAAGRAFRNPSGGPLGLAAFWRHAIYAGSLVQVLGKSLAAGMRPKPGLSQLTGMLHNFGVLLLGDLFPAEFYWLNRQVEQHPQVPLMELEQRALGIDHTELGAMLMERWNMPPEVVVAIREHHNSSYDGIHAVYANLALIANRLLLRIGLGDAETSELPVEMLQRYGLSNEQTDQVLASVLESAPTLDLMAAQLAHTQAGSLPAPDL